MDIARRVAKIVQNNQGLLAFLALPEPTTGFAVVDKVITYDLASLDATTTVEAIRSFLVTNLLKSDGVAVYRRSGNLNMCLVKVYPTQAEAVQNARISGVAYVVDLSTKTNIQVGDFAPNVPGDGDV